ncbi:embryonic polyadenylate-binding protein 2 isoform X5 [Felis catus]|uniref:embryonic polyadenylate-binding protein 2 isoform X5 n=1 Tax=Felis catus TaxID=9685 RepID=UPI001D19EE76|nr:embryonic polyadenylate-binding protein 2 isoform X5 [Felis catus]
MWPFLSHALFPPPTRAWLQRASSDPEAQGWGAWGRAEKPPLEPGSGDRKEGEPGEAEKDPEDAGFPLSLLEREELAEYPEADQELEAIKVKLWAMEQAQGPEPPGAQGQAGREEGAGATPAGQLLSPEAGCTCPGPPTEQLESDHRSVYVGNLRLHRVCCRELSPGRGGVGQEHLPRPSHQGAAQKDQLAGDQLYRPRGLPRTARRQRRTVPPQQPPGRGPLQTSGAEPGPWTVFTLVFTVLKGGSDFESGAGVGRE